MTRRLLRREELRKKDNPSPPSPPNLTVDVEQVREGRATNCYLLINYFNTLQLITKISQPQTIYTVNAPLSPITSPF